jgi:hypothetical protein
VNRGLFRTAAPLSSDLTLIVELMMGLALVAGMLLARRRRYRAHARCQSAVVLLNPVAITLTMAPSFWRSFAPPPSWGSPQFVLCARGGARCVGSCSRVARAIHPGGGRDHDPPAALSVHLLQALDAHSPCNVVAGVAARNRNIFQMVRCAVVDRIAGNCGGERSREPRLEVLRKAYQLSIAS